MLCPAGKYSLAAAGVCTPCPAGTFGNASGVSSPQCSGLCVAGTFGELPGLVVSTCSGVCTGMGFRVIAVRVSVLCAAPTCGFACNRFCVFVLDVDRLFPPAGYYCVAGSTSPTSAACPPGRYSLAGSPSCSDCPIGFYGATSNLSTAACTGKCLAGSYGATTGMVVSTCSGPCSVGHYCVEGSTSPTATPCPAGSYSDSPGAVACTPCPGGSFGSTTGLATAACSGGCSAGYACPAGSTNSTAVQCPAGQYSVVSA